MPQSFEVFDRTKHYVGKCGGLHTFANPCHGQNDGRFCETPGDSKSAPASDSGGFKKSLLGPAIDAINKAESTPATTTAAPSSDFTSSLSKAIGSLPSDKKDWFTGPSKNKDGSVSDQYSKVELTLNSIGGLMDSEINSRILASGRTTVVPESDPEKRKGLQADIADLTQTIAIMFDCESKDGSGPGKISGPKGSDIFADTSNSNQPNDCSVLSPKSWAELVLDKADLENKLNGSANYPDVYAEFAQKLLSEIRPMGGEDFKVKGGNDQTKNMVQSAQKFYPTQWIQDSNDKSTLRLGMESRGHYDNADSKLVLSGDSNTVAVHELAHRMAEVNPWIKEAEWTFFQRRTTDPTTGKQEPTVTIPGYKSSESGKLDTFQNPYMGKRYSSSPNDDGELFSMGVQGLFSPGFDDSTVTDPDYNRHILGLLAAG